MASARLIECGLKIGQQYLLKIPDDFVGNDKQLESWNNKKVTLAATNSQRSFWIEVTCPGLTSWLEGNAFAAEPDWLHSLCSCDMSLILYQGCQCGGL